MLVDRYSESFLQEHFLPRNEWRPFPPAADRAVWNGLMNHTLNRERRRFIVTKAEPLLNHAWPALPATLFMENTRTGNRSNFEKPYFERRTNLSILAMAECFEHKGRFMDEIVNGIWLITEEATWAVSAHAKKAPLGDSQDPLPDQAEETLDLSSLQTAAILAEIDHILATELGAVSSAIRDRIRRQVIQRIITTFENSPDAAPDTPHLWWLDGRNNWTPWCCSNLLTAAMYLLDDQAQLARIAWRCMSAVDLFIAGYDDDGGCDEGPAYWGLAAGTMLRFLELLHSRTNGAVDIYTEPKLRAMGLFICRAHLDGPWFANFADAHPKPAPARAVTWRYGERVKAPAMLDLVADRMRGIDGRVDPPIQTHNFKHMLRELFWMPPDIGSRTCAPEPCVWLPDLQVMVSRNTTTHACGLIIAAKAGHNDENHNHNDVGQFIIMLNGMPLIIDVGTEDYTGLTFSNKRYTLWTHRGSGHNVPLVNGIEQAYGREHAAAAVRFIDSGSTRVLTMDLAATYPVEAEIKYLVRTITHRTGDPGTIAIEDNISAIRGPLIVTVPLFTPARPVQQKEGWVLGSGQARLVLETGPGVTVTCKERPVTDPRLVSDWGDMLWQIECTLATPESTARMELKLREKPASNRSGEARP